MKLAGLRRRAAFGLWLEALTAAGMPSLGIVLAYAAASLFGLGSSYAFAAVLLLAGIALARGLWRLRRPSPDEIDRRIERRSGLLHRPVAMIDDTPANETPVAAAIWRLHQRRLERDLLNARAGWPAGAAAADPYAVRALLLLLTLSGAVIAGASALPRLRAGFELPGLPAGAPAPEVWITPPAYVGAPPQVLVPGVVTAVLAGSRLTVIVNRNHVPRAVLGGRPIRFARLAAGSFRADLPLTAPARLRIGPWWHPAAVYRLSVVPAEPPEITAGPAAARDGWLIFRWQAHDRYGLASLGARLMPDGHPDALPELLDLPLDGGSRTDPLGTAQAPIADSPFAGLPVSLVVEARNLAGVPGHSAPLALVLPSPGFTDKTAAGLAALRQALALAPGTQSRLGLAVQQLALVPASPIGADADLQIAYLAREMRGDELLPEQTLKIMGRIAQQIERGPDFQPAEALAAANAALTQALRQALRQGAELDGARLQSLLNAMHQALAQHLQALGPGAAPPDAASLAPGDLDRLAQQIASDAASGQTAKAQAELNQLQQMLTALQNARPLSPAQAARAAAAGQAAAALSRITRAQAALLDATQQGAGTPDAEAALRQQLAGQRQNLAKAGISLPGLGDAADQMAQAQDALGRQQIENASSAQARAIRLLQKAAADLAQSQGTLFRAGALGAGGPAAGGASGVNGGPDETALPGLLPSSENPAAVIERQIMKNDAQPDLPAPVHRYYHRLLNLDAP